MITTSTKHAGITNPKKSHTATPNVKHPERKTRLNPEFLHSIGTIEWWCFILRDGIHVLDVVSPDFTSSSRSRLICHSIHLYTPSVVVESLKFGCIQTTNASSNISSDFPCEVDWVRLRYL